MPVTVVDYSYARPTVAEIKAYGAVGVIRYVSRTASKNLTVDEYARLRGGGLAVGLVWEEGKSSALGGYPRGAADAKEANAQADALGFPSGRPVYFTVDVDVTQDQLFTVLDYLRGAATGRRPVGVYGEHSVIEAAAAADAAGFFWQTIAWSGGKQSPARHLLQNRFYADVDTSDIRTGVTDWGQDTVRMPGTTWQPLPENQTAGTIRPTQVILHTVVGSGNPYGYFATQSNLESHFWVSLTGGIHQFMDCTRQADANYEANVRAISVETADNGDPDHYPWQPPQIKAILDIIRWVHATYGVPIVRCPAWDAPGVGYHTMWGAPSHWTPVAKTCPGAARIQQFPEILRLAAGGSELDMQLSDPINSAEAVFDGWTVNHVYDWMLRVTLTHGQVLTGLTKAVAALAAGQTIAQADLNTIQADLDDIQATLARLTPTAEPDAE